MGYRIRQATKQGWIECPYDGVADLSYPDSLTRRGRVTGGGSDQPYNYSESERDMQDGKALQNKETYAQRVLPFDGRFGRTITKDALCQQQHAML